MMVFGCHDRSTPSSPVIVPPPQVDHEVALDRHRHGGADIDGFAARFEVAGEGVLHNGEPVVT